MLIGMINNWGKTERHTDNSKITTKEMKGDIDKISLIETIDILEHLTFLELHTNHVRHYDNV